MTEQQPMFIDEMNNEQKQALLDECELEAMRGLKHPKTGEVLSVEEAKKLIDLSMERGKMLDEMKAKVKAKQVAKRRLKAKTAKLAKRKNRKK